MAASSSTTASLVELAEDWFTAKRAMESASQAQKGHSDRARRGDLARWAHLLALILGRCPEEGELPGEEVLARLTLADLTSENVVRAVAAAKASYAEATVARMLSHLRGWTRWLYRTGHLASDPCEDEMLRARPSRERRPRALSADDVERLLGEAARPSAQGRMWWPARDIAVVRFLATTGSRAEEVVLRGHDRRDRPGPGAAHLAGQQGY